MTFVHILAFAGYALLVGWILPVRWRNGAVLFGSLMALYVLQPSTPIRHLDFWLPTASLALVLFTWAVIRPQNPGSGLSRREVFQTIGLVAGVVLIIGLMPYFLGKWCCLTPSRPPGLPIILIAIALLGGSSAALYQWRSRHPARFGLLWGMVILLLLLFIVLKSEDLARLASAGLRSINRQPVALASSLDLSWLGFSYLAFRLLHVLRDAQMGDSPPAKPVEFCAYALFFPSLTAGPIDRLPRFLGDLSKHSRAFEDLTVGGQRLLLGVFKKFVLADQLGLIALNSQNALQVTSSGWMWILLYAYSLRIYLDFSGYTDVAIGLARWMGFRLPENFDRPYLKSNLTAFWNSWHITLAQWFRAYFFYPLARALRSRRFGSKPVFPAWAVVLISQFSTMILIGLWHGLTWNFLAWGAWHGLGLFVHNRWADWLRPRQAFLEARPNLRRLWQVFSWLLTFHYVTLGWVWFALSQPWLAFSVFSRLFGH